MASRRVSGAVMLPAHVLDALGEAVRRGGETPSQHLRLFGHRCGRTEIEMSVAPDSLARAGLEQLEWLDDAGRLVLLMGAAESWARLVRAADPDTASPERVEP